MYTSETDSIYAGRFRSNTLLDVVSNMSENQWQKLNTNLFSDVWPESDLRSPYGAGKARSDSVIIAWSSFAWDSNNSRLILWGGGHANTSDNSVFVWDGDSLEWELAFYPSDYYTISSGVHSPICGGARQPCSAHTYDNQVYLPIIDKFLTLGGAQHGTGGGWTLYDGDSSSTVLRGIPAYTLDLTQAGQGKVAGATGDNPHDGDYAAIDLDGANAWTVRDWYATTQGDALAGNGINCGTAYREESGVDVVYATRSSSGAKSLYRMEFHADIANDVITKVGQYWNGSGGIGVAALDTVNNVFLFNNNIAGYPFVFWDLKSAGAFNKEVRIPDAGLTGADAAELIALLDTSNGLDYSTSTNKFYVWTGGGDVYTITPPAGDPTPSTGWLVEKQTYVSGDKPEDLTGGAADVGIIGKWKYAPELGCFIALQHSQNGDVWMYKPNNWSI